MHEIARTIAERLAAPTAPVSVLVPTRGLSLSGRPGEALWDEEANAAFVQEIAAAVAPPVELESIESHVNDPAFADRVAERAVERFAGLRPAVSG
jgi:uncharacterized protein (UPF0261 family)